MTDEINRRQFLQTAATVTAASGLSSSLFGQVCLPQEGTVRDRLWVFCNPINADFDALRRRSVMSPFEGAVYLGVPNIAMVDHLRKPARSHGTNPSSHPSSNMLSR